MAFFHLPGLGFTYLIEFSSSEHARYLPEVKAVNHYETDSPGYDSQWYVQIALRPHHKNAVGASWQWDGNREKPTITPSINCEKVCGWHGFIVGGEFKP